ncbi:hypothetical protein JKA74_12920 [Marivirga sp. S37H4]|uniref:PorZ N-terminal beta-propeller domain-containing protein n=1 Tax=Marivirga aurantiaca TaxID=2802615 RepID=A0A934WZ94_9BACT|nr:hypothetical protein [Marivirga aurantiaca]MBK6265938.1 hypothetical protein [Marivirga aurantiaca]
MLLKYFLPLIFMLLFQSLTAQNIPLGSWRSHTDYSNSHFVSEFDGKIFTAGPSGVFYYDTEDESINTLSTTTGLSTTHVTAMEVIPEENVLIIGYKDGTLDIIDEELSITTFNEITRSDIIHSKKINSITFQNSIAYLATDFGVVLYDVQGNQFIDFYNNLDSTGNPLTISHISLDADNIYLSAPEGLLTGSLAPQVNLKDFQNWQRDPVDEGENIALSKTVIFNNQLYALANNNIIYQENNQDWDTIFQSQEIIHNILAEADQFWALAGKEALQYQNNQFVSLLGYPEAGGLMDLISTESIIYLADSTEALLKYEQNTFHSIQPQGPQGEPEILRQLENFTFNMNNVFPGFSYFLEGRWYYVGSDNEGSILPHFIDVELDLISGNGIFLSRTQGLYSWDTETIEPITTPADNSGIEWLELAVDPEAKIWILGRRENNNFVLYNSTDEVQYNLLLNPNFSVSDFEIVFNGDKYIATNNGIYVFNESSEEPRLLTSSLGNGNLSGNNVTDLALDLSGNLWIGTERGVCFFNNYNGVLTGESVDAIKPIFEGFFLFEGIKVNNIAIDGGNRKWMATRDGLWLFNEEINENLIHFRKDNSPVVENNIREMVINPFNGEVFVASDNQLLSYRTDATRATATHAKVEVFPNPVRLSSNNTVTIRGLAYNNEVMITDVAGNVIYKGKANGGTFHWDLNTYSGFRAGRGVYLVFSINNEGTETYQGKFAVVN